MDTDRNLLLGVRALQDGLIDASQFVEACTLWSARPGACLADLLMERGWIDGRQRALLEMLLQGEQPRHDSSVTLDVVVSADGTFAQQPPKKSAKPRTQALLTPPLIKSQAEAAERLTQPQERYTLDMLHATGGMGRVWLARDTWLDRAVALKDLRPEVADNGTVRARFLREARITSQLEHPGIVPVYELAKRPTGNEPFYTMRFVKGRTLTEAAEAFHNKRREGQLDMLDFASLLGAFVTVCNTIAYAHSRGVIHRDLKGNNVLLGDFGEVIVLDWGLAKQLDYAENELTGLSDLALPLGIDQTMQGEVMGTPAFMAPEQAAGQVDRLDRRTDIYGLGAVLYEILTGEPPFSGVDTMEVLGQVLRTAPLAPHHHWEEVPPALEAACLKALSKEPAQRFQAAAELSQEVMSWQEVQRRQAEDALRRQTEVLQSILNSMSEAVLVADVQGKLLHFNPAAERLLGVQTADATLDQARQHYSLFRADKVTRYPPEELPLVRAIRGEVTDDAELFIAGPARPDGFWASANARPLKDEHGALRGGVLVIRDISERKRVEEELRRSRERFALAVQGSQDGLWDWDLDTNVVYFSPRWKSIIGYEDHEIAHRIEEWDQRLHPDERDTVLAANLAHIEGRTPFYEHEYRLRHKNGSYRWILARGVALRDANGKAYRMAGSHVDVTERKEAEKALREAQECYRAVMAALPVGILVLDAVGNLRAYNASAERLLGSALQQSGPLALPDTLRPDASPLPPEELPPYVALRTGRACAAMVVGLQPATGAIRWISMRAQPLLRDGNGTPVGAVAVLEDVTDLPQCK
jgi:PAS domain S-box-containing protein